MTDTLQETISQDTINKALWDACDTFRGTISSDTYKDFILTMLFLKYISDVWQDHYDKYQEEYGDEPELIAEMMKNERFVIPEIIIKDDNGKVTDRFMATFYSLYDRRHEPGNGERIDICLHEIEEANGTKLRDGSKSVFQDISFNTDKLGEEKQKNTILRYLMENFDKPELNLKPSRVGKLDVIGNAYEYLIGEFASGGGKKAGEFYTPPAVSDLIAELVEPEEGMEVCDPACGSGSLLMKVGRKVRENTGSKKYALYGQEAIGSTWSLAKMNMFLHGEDNHKVEWGDTIRNPKLLDKEGNLKLFDIVVANPPFSLDKWGHEGAADDKFDRFRRGVPPKTKGDYAFILHMIETLKPASHDTTGGRMGVVVPHGVLFRGAAEGKIRTKLIEENLLDAVIGLPEKLFYGTGIPAAVLIFKKQKSDEKVLFIDASREFKAGKNQNLLTPENIDKIVTVYRKFCDPTLTLPLLGEGTFASTFGGSDEALAPLPDKGEAGRGVTPSPDKGRVGVGLVDKYAYVATFDEIKENDFNLNIPRYVDTFEEEEEIDLMVVRQEREALKSKLADLEVEMDGYLKELGYV